VWGDFEAQWMELDADHGRVHLLIEYPAKAAASALVNSLKGGSSQLLRVERPDSERWYCQGVL
jgi:putative transposase